VEPRDQALIEVALDEVVDDVRPRQAVLAPERFPGMRSQSLGWWSTNSSDVPAIVSASSLEIEGGLIWAVEGPGPRGSRRDRRR